MWKWFSKQLAILLSLVVLLAWKGAAPIAAQTPSRENVPSPTEPALSPIEPIEPEIIPEEPEPTIDIEDLRSEPEAGAASTDDCLPLAQTDEEVRFLATNIEIIDSTVLQAEIEQKVSCYEGEEITLSDLFNLRSQITQLYIDNGYITSGAFIPTDQVFTDNPAVQVIEGSIEEIQVNGLSRLRDGYVRDRLRRTSRPPLNQDDLQEALQLLQLDPSIRQVNAELTAGTQPGRSLLILDLKETRAFNFLADANNNRSPSIGSEGLNFSANYRNLLGIGDVLSASYGFTEGLDLYDVGLSLPLNASDGTLSLRYNNSGSRIVEDDFEDVGIRSETETVSVGIHQPIVRTPSEEFALGLDFDWRTSQSFILDDIPFSFSVGPEDGRSQVSTIRFSQDWTQRGATQVLAARSQFNVGLDILGATDNNTGTDGQFFSWLGQFQWVKQASPRLLSLVKVNAQLTPDSLLPLERFSLGGLSTVRGYAQNQLVSDNALNASAELRIPLTRDANVLQLTPFVDAGYGWNNRMPNPDTQFLLGTGVGLRWQATPELFLRTDYGLALVDADNTGNSLQDNGLYFSVTYQPN